MKKSKEGSPFDISKEGRKEVILRTSSPILLAITVTCFHLCLEEDHLA